MRMVLLWLEVRIMTKICKMCGREFEAERSNAVYCSLVCREAGRKVSRNNWNRANKDYYRQYAEKHAVLHGAE